MRDPLGESYEWLSESARRRGSAAAVSPWRRDGETRETESETTRPTPARARPTPPRETRSTCHCCRRLPFPDLPSPASSLHRITVHRITGIYSLTLIFSFKFQNLVNLWSELFVFFFFVLGFWLCDCVCGSFWLAALHYIDKTHKRNRMIDREGRDCSE